MTTHELVATLRQGAPVTSRLVREIITHLERLDWAERSLKAALEKYGAENVQLTRDECGYVCEALEESERLKESVRWMLEVQGVVNDNILCPQWRRHTGLSDIERAARKAVEEML